MFIFHKHNKKETTKVGFRKYFFSYTRRTERYILKKEFHKQNNKETTEFWCRKVKVRFLFLKYSVYTSIKQIDLNSSIKPHFVVERYESRATFWKDIKS